MNNNDVLRRLRYTFNYNDKQMVAIFSSAEEEVTREQISQWLKKDNDDDFVAIPDVQLATFLNGFINEKRGKKPGPQNKPENRLNNNVVLTKLKIALNLKAEDMLLLLESVDFRLSKPELSAFSRKKDHKHYRECKDQVLRNLLHAIDKKYHVERTVKIAKAENKKQSYQANNKSKPEAKTKTGARPNASSLYINPKATTSDKRKPLKLNKTQPD